MTPYELVKQKINDNCPNCNKALICKPTNYDPELMCCDDCNIKIEIENLCVHIMYYKYNVRIDLTYEIMSYYDLDVFHIDSIPANLDIQSVLNFIAIYETFQ